MIKVTSNQVVFFIIKATRSKKGIIALVIFLLGGIVWIMATDIDTVAVTNQNLANTNSIPSGKIPDGYQLVSVMEFTIWRYSPLEDYSVEITIKCEKCHFTSANSYADWIRKNARGSVEVYEFSGSKILNAKKHYSLLMSPEEMKGSVSADKNGTWLYNESFYFKGENNVGIGYIFDKNYRMAAKFFSRKYNGITPEILISFDEGKQHSTWVIEVAVILKYALIGLALLSPVFISVLLVFLCCIVS